MKQHVIRHAEGTLRACAGCQREPIHVESHGRTAREGLSATPGQIPVRHHIECPRCGRQTSRSAGFELAADEWGIAYTQAPLPLRIVKGRKTA